MPALQYPTDDNLTRVIAHVIEITRALLPETPDAIHENGLQGQQPPIADCHGRTNSKPSGYALVNDPALILLNQNQLAELFDCSPRTLERQRLEGTGVPFIRVGRLVRYRLTDVQAYIERQRCTSTSDANTEKV